MYISITSFRVKYDQAAKVDKFLNKFLPRLKQQDGVHAVYNYSRPEKGDVTTVIIWENEDALKRYRQSDLMKEIINFEQQMNLQSIRESYPLQMAIVG